jgi:hypothetical protein
LRIKLLRETCSFPYEERNFVSRRRFARGIIGSLLGEISSNLNCSQTCWVMVKAVIWKVMLRRRGHRSYHYAATKYSQRDPRRGEAITVRNLDNTLVKAVIAHIAREQTRLKRRVFTVQADEV